MTIPNPLSLNAKKVHLNMCFLSQSDYNKTSGDGKKFVVGAEGLEPPTSSV